jgi:hypothetical protein
MSSTTLSLAGELRYLSHAAERHGEERGREFFRVDVYPDGCRTIAAHAEIDDAPAVVRDVNLRLDSQGLPADCFVRIAVGGNFCGSGWFLFSEGKAECQAMTVTEGRVSQVLQQSRPLPAFGNHAIVNDGYLMSLYDLSAGPGTQVIEKMLLSSPDHRGATGPMMFITDVTIQFHGRESIEVEAGHFNALKYSIIDVPGLPLEHPPYNLWCTDDGNFILLKADVGGYMKTAYELVSLQKTTAGAD